MGGSDYHSDFWTKNGRSEALASEPLRPKGLLDLSFATSSNRVAIILWLDIQ